MDNPTAQPLRFKITDKATGKDATGEFYGFVSLLELDKLAPGRHSQLLLLLLYHGWKSGSVDPQAVLSEIAALETLGPQSVLKAPIQNRHPPLKGLWHKHFREPVMRSIAMNVLKALKKGPGPFLSGKQRDSERKGKASPVPLSDVDAIGDDMIYGNIQRLQDKQAMTGDWLIYARHEDKNYYLCIGPHETGTHATLRKLIDSVCCVEFPFLPKLLADAVDADL